MQSSIFLHGRFSLTAPRQQHLPVPAHTSGCTHRTLHTKQAGVGRNFQIFPLLSYFQIVAQADFSFNVNFLRPLP